MKDIYEYIKEDHKKVSNLFKQFEKALTEQQMIEIVAYISEELLIHAESEQATFYKAIENHPEYKKDIAHAKHEHADIEKLLMEVNSADRVDENWKGTVLQLKKAVEHHVKEEEHEVFSDAKKIFSEAEAWMLKEKMHDLKEKIRAKLEVTA